MTGPVVESGLERPRLHGHVRWWVFIHIPVARSQEARRGVPDDGAGSPAADARRLRAPPATGYATPTRRRRRS